MACLQREGQSRCSEKYQIAALALCPWSQAARSGSLADIKAPAADVRFTPKADMVEHCDVRFVPKGFDSTPTIAIGAYYAFKASFTRETLIGT